MDPLVREKIEATLLLVFLGAVLWGFVGFTLWLFF